MSSMLDQYAQIVGEQVINHLKQLAAPLEGTRVVHINSTKEGGGVAEILQERVGSEGHLGDHHRGREILSVYQEDA